MVEPNEFGVPQSVWGRIRKQCERVNAFRKSAVSRFDLLKFKDPKPEEENDEDEEPEATD